MRNLGAEVSGARRARQTPHSATLGGPRANRCQNPRHWGHGLLWPGLRPSRTRAPRGRRGRRLQPRRVQAAPDGPDWQPDSSPIRYFLGDIRDKERLLRAFNGMDYVVHAAALKHVPALEDNPFEAVRTNVLGAQNIIEAALERGVQASRRHLDRQGRRARVNLYGATKLVMEKLLVAANTYVRYRDIRFSVVRYGNVVGSRGSVIPLFAELVRKGCPSSRSPTRSMTRFWITLDQGVDLVLGRCRGQGRGDLRPEDPKHEHGRPPARHAGDAEPRSAAVRARRSTRCSSARARASAPWTRGVLRHPAGGRERGAADLG